MGPDYDFHSEPVSSRTKVRIMVEGRGASRGVEYALYAVSGMEVANTAQAESVANRMLQDRLKH
jgi:hypothetical protein